MSDLDNIKEVVKNLLLTQRFATLASDGENYPYTSLVAFIYDADEEKLYFGTLKDTAKYENIKKNSHVSLLIDNEKNSSADIYNTQALTLLGKAKEVYGEKRNELKDAFFRRQACLRQFLDEENCAIVEVHIHKYIFAHNLNQVTAFENI